MPRVCSSLAALLLAAGGASAQELPPPSPVDLVRGLRESGMPDLAVEYLADLAVKPPADVAAVLPLERAKCLLDLANLETDETVRAGVIADAKAEFDKFLKAAPNHPRRAEAAVALARLLTLEGKARLQLAKKHTDPAKRKAEAALARPLFDTAAKQYGTAAAGLEKLAAADGLAPARKTELVREWLQASLDRGINLYLLADSYIDPQDKEVDARSQAAQDALKAFRTVWQADAAHPVSWTARAWAGETLYLRGDPTLADDQLRRVIEEARRATTTPGAAAGLRMARFFQLRQQFVDKQNDPIGRQQVRDACLGWLRDYPSARPTAETYAVTYYLGSVLLNEGLKKENLLVERVAAKKPGEPPEERVVGVKADALRFLRDADAQFRKVVRTDNEYTDRAARQRARAVRWLIGDPDRPPAAFATFDDCYMAALVQMDRLRDTPPEQRPAVAGKMVALLERGRELPVPPESVRDATAAALVLAEAYTAAGRPHRGAVLAEGVARTSRNPTQAIRAALIALAGYKAASGSADADAKAADRDRMLALCGFAEKLAPADPLTDGLRMEYGVLLSQAGRGQDMFEAFARIPARYPKFALARLYEGVAAYELTRPRGASEPPTDALSPEKKAEVYKRAVADLSAVPVPPKNAAPDDAATFVRLRLQLAQLHIAAGPAGYPLAEKTAADAVKVAGELPTLPPDEKPRLLMRAEILRTKAVFGQGWPLYEQGKFAAAADRFAPLLAEMVKGGPAAKPDLQGETAEVAKQLDAERIRLVLVPTLNARIREGAVDKAGQLLDQLKAFGGDLATTARVVQQGIATIKPTVDTLRKEGKDDEATKLVTAVSGLVNKLAAEKNVPPEVRFNLGRAFKDLGELGKAVELFAQLPPPEDKAFLPGDPKATPPENEPAEAKKKREAAFEANKSAAALYRLAQLELLRCHRLARQLDKCDALLDDILGKDRKGGWGQKFPDFRRETLYLAEAKASEAKTPKEAIPHWNTAIRGWLGWANEYKAVIDNLKAKPDDPDEKVNEVRKRKEALKPAWHDLMSEYYRCSVDAQAAINKSDPAKLAATLGTQAGRILDFEKGNPALAPAVRLRLFTLMETYPELKEAYTKAGGTESLKAPAVGQ